MTWHWVLGYAEQEWVTRPPGTLPHAPCLLSCRIQLPCESARL